MIIKFIEYSISCDNCNKTLSFAIDDPINVAYQGHPIREATIQHENQVAEDYNWEVIGNRHLCPQCK